MSKLSRSSVLLTLLTLALAGCGGESGGGGGSSSAGSFSVSALRPVPTTDTAYGFNLDGTGFTARYEADGTGRYVRGTTDRDVAATLKLKDLEAFSSASLSLIGNGFFAGTYSGGASGTEAGTIVIRAFNLPTDPAGDTISYFLTGDDSTPVLLSGGTYVNGNASQNATRVITQVGTTYTVRTYLNTSSTVPDTTLNAGDVPVQLAGDYLLFTRSGARYVRNLNSGAQAQVSTPGTLGGATFTGTSPVVINAAGAAYGAATYSDGTVHLYRAVLDEGAATPSFLTPEVFPAFTNLQSVAVTSVRLDGQVVSITATDASTLETSGYLVLSPDSSEVTVRTQKLGSTTGLTRANAAFSRGYATSGGTNTLYSLTR